MTQELLTPEVDTLHHVDTDITIAPDIEIVSSAVAGAYHRITHHKMKLNICSDNWSGDHSQYSDNWSDWGGDHTVHADY